MKTLTRKQLESRKAQAVRFTRDVLDDPDRAEEIAKASPRNTTPKGDAFKFKIPKE